MQHITQRRALILEDDNIWARLYRQDIQGDYAITICTTLNQAMQALYHQSYHLIILDLQLNTKNPKDREGKRLISRIRNHHWVDKSVVTVISDVMEISGIEGINEILEHDLERDNARLQQGLLIQDIMFFVKSRYDGVVFWESLSRLLRQRKLDGQVQIQQLDILFSLSQRVLRNLKDLIETNRIAVYDEWLKELDNHLLEERIQQEVYDLLHMSFRHADSIYLEQIGDGFSKASVIKVVPQRGEQFGRSRIVKLGYHSEIQLEFDNFDEYVDYFLDKHPEGRAGGRTPLLQSILYRELDQVLSFQQVFHDSKWSTEQLEEAMVKLFKDCCGNWYRGVTDKVINCNQSYSGFLHCYPERFLKPLEYLSTFAGFDNQYYVHAEKIHFDGIDTEFSNPYLIFQDKQKMNSLVSPTKQCVTHGDFNANNIFFRIRDEHGRQTLDEAWLIDFYRTGPHHALRDFIQLETVIKFFLLKDASLSERYQLEQELIKPDHFRDLEHVDITAFKPGGSHAAMLIRAYRIIHKIRTLAWELVLDKEQDGILGSFRQYNMGLFFLSLNSVRFVRIAGEMEGISEIQSLHALMATAMLVKKLDLN